MPDEPTTDTANTDTPEVVYAPRAFSVACGPTPTVLILPAGLKVGVKLTASTRNRGHHESDRDDPFYGFGADLAPPTLDDPAVGGVPLAPGQSEFIPKEAFAGGAQIRIVSRIAGKVRPVVHVLAV